MTSVLTSRHIAAEYALLIARAEPDPEIAVSILDAVLRENNMLLHLFRDCEWEELNHMEQALILEDMAYDEEFAQFIGWVDGRYVLREDEMMDEEEGMVDVGMVVEDMVDEGMVDVLMEDELVEGDVSLTMRCWRSFLGRAAYEQGMKG